MCTKIYNRYRHCSCPTPCFHPIGTLVACRAFLTTGSCPQSRAIWSGEYVHVPCKAHKMESKAKVAMRGPRVTGETQDSGGAGSAQHGTSSAEVGDSFGGYSPHASDESITGVGVDDLMAGTRGDENIAGTGQDESAETGGGSNEQSEGGASAGESKKPRKTFVDYYWEHIND